MNYTYKFIYVPRDYSCHSKFSLESIIESYFFIYCQVDLLLISDGSFTVPLLSWGFLNFSEVLGFFYDMYK